jgi:uncharacterized protein (TIGR03034 family)
MSKITYIGGDYIEWTGGEYTEYSNKITISTNQKINITADGEKRFGDKPEDSPIIEHTDLRITKLEGPFDKEGKLVKTVKKGTFYTYKATPNRKPNEVEPKMLKWATQSDEGKKKELKGVSSYNQLDKEGKIIINIAINEDCKKTKVYAYFIKPSDEVRVKFDLAPPILILQGTRRKGKKIIVVNGKKKSSSDTSIDMLYADYAENELGFEKLRKQLYEENYDVEKQDSWYNIKSREDYAKEESDYTIGKIKEFCKKTNNKLFEIFRNDITYYSSGKVEEVAIAMVDKMSKNEGGEFINLNLTNGVIAHENSISFINSIEKVIKEYLRKNNGEIEKLNIKDDSNGLLYALLVRDKVDNPKFSDKFSGLGITINDVWAYQVYVKSYKTNGNKFEMELEYIYYDHFGLDYPDIQKYDKNIFYSWFVLQHFRGYKPFITKINIVSNLKGTF